MVDKFYQKAFPLRESVGIRPRFLPAFGTLIMIIFPEA
jgi:hypothetical protein